jgi:uncharacterized protein with GYD domain
MPTYIILGNFTQDGITNIKESPQRLEASRKNVQALGGEMKDFFYTMGRYDFVGIIEFPSNEVAMQSLFNVGKRGSVRTETLVAIPAAKGVEIIKKLP